MFFLAFRGALSRSRWASALTQRNAPLARPMSPSDMALAENSSNKATGSGLDHSPSVHALYHPTEPEVASRTSGEPAIQSNDGFGSRRAKAEPPPRTVRQGGVQATACQPAVELVEHLVDRRGASRAMRPPPVANPRSPSTRCSPRVLMAESYELDAALSSGMRKARAESSAAWIRNGVAADRCRSAGR